MMRLETPRKTPVRIVEGLGGAPERKPKLFDTAIIGDPQAASRGVQDRVEIGEIGLRHEA